MSHGEIESFDTWISNNGTAFVRFCEQNKLVDRRRLLRLWLEMHYQDWAMTINALGRKAIVRFHEVITDPYAPRDH